MSTFTQHITETFHVVSCYTCGVNFGINEELYNRVVTDAEGSVHCPACGRSTCWRESAATKQIRQLKNEVKAGERRTSTAQRRADNMEALVDDERAEGDRARASLRSTKGVVTKLKKRVAHGVCPCCTRTFKQLARHMKSKHPDYAPAPTEQIDGDT